MSSIDVLPCVDNRWLERKCPVSVHPLNSKSGSSVDNTPYKERKTSNSDGVSDVELPPGTQPLTNQVAGHRKGPGSMVMLKCDEGQVLKHVQPPPKGYREVEFYRSVFQSDVRDPVILSLRRYIPLFWGTTPEGPVENVRFIKMSDVTDRFTRPCISDIKMGRLTYDPLATAEKQKCELEKYPPGLNLGFQMLGMRVFNSEEDKYDIYDRKYGRSLTESQMLDDGLAVYFGGWKNLREEAVQCTLAHLREIEAWFESQSQLSFYASSLLLIYEGQDDQVYKEQDNILAETVLDKQEKCSSCGRRKNCCSVDVKMIDFAHVFKTTEPDENYLFGLRNLIQHLDRLLH